MVTEIDQNEILLAEFNYAAQSATQSNEDRARVTALYFVTVGTLVAAIFGISIEPRDSLTLHNLHLIFLIVFQVLSIHSVLTILELVRLRLAWIECARTMNEIKDYYISTVAAPKLELAFRWRTWTIPPAFKLNSVSSLMAVQVAVLGGITFGSSLFFIGLIRQQILWTYIVIAASIFFFLQMILYWIFLR